MGIPDYQTLMRPVLEAARHEPRKISDVVVEVADLLGLTDDERREMLPSGRQTTIANRIHWARTYLKQAGLVRSVRRGWYALTDRGRSVLDDATIDLNTKYLEQFEEFQEFRTRGQNIGEAGAEAQAPDVPLPDGDTPDESLQLAHKRLEDALAASLLDNVRAAAPAFFEQLIVDLLISMGYGGSSEDAGRALGQTGDDGVDGVVDQDPLGVDQIYLQAKRYQAGNNIGAAHIRDFYGALSLKRASKGIFVTTSQFSTSADKRRKALARELSL